MKKLTSLMMALCLVFVLAVPALAMSYERGDWSVTFTQDEKMVQNFGESNTERTQNRLNTMLDDEIRGLQPGDDIVFTLTLTNQHPTTTDWYMTNEVLDSLEATTEHGATHAGAYTYTLTYRKNGSSSSETLFDSDTVGGDVVVVDREGLREATGALEDFFYLDTLKQGESGVVTLRVALDGETQGNDYQDTLADLQMNFGVELNTTGGTPNPSASPNASGSVVKTGDEMRLLPYYIAMGISGILFLALAIDSVRRRKREKEGQK